MLLKNDEVYAVHFNNGQSFTGKMVGQDAAGVALESLTGEKWVWIPFTAIRKLEKVQMRHD